MLLSPQVLSEQLSILRMIYIDSTINVVHGFIHFYFADLKFALGKCAMVVISFATHGQLVYNIQGPSLILQQLMVQPVL